MDFPFLPERSLSSSSSNSILKTPSAPLISIMTPSTSPNLSVMDNVSRKSWLLEFFVGFVAKVYEGYSD